MNIHSPGILGLPIQTAGLGTSTLALNAANTQMLYTFVASESKTLSKVKFYVSAVAGTLGGSDIVAELWSMPTGSIGSTTGPSSLLESRATVTATPTGAAWVEVTGFTGSSALTAGVQYAILIKNANGTPGTNYPTLRYTSGSYVYLIGQSWNGWTKKHTTDGGSTWTGGAASIVGVRLEMSTGELWGSGIETGGATAVGVGVYSSRELGALFTTPSQVKLRVAGMGAYVTATGSPTGFPRGRLYAGTSLLATTGDSKQYVSTSTLQMWFSSVQELAAGTAHRVALGESTQSDASGNRFNLHEFTIENAAASKALLPFGSWVRTYYDGSSWTDTDTGAPAIWLILDSDRPFGVVPATPPPGFRIAGAPRPLPRR